VQRIAAARQPLDERQREACVAEPRRRLGQQPSDPASRRAIKTRVTALGEQDENRERVIEADRRQLGGGELDDVQVACRQRTLKPCIGGALRCHERMFAGTCATYQSTVVQEGWSLGWALVRVGLPRGSFRGTLRSTTDPVWELGPSCAARI
jgi:hypothetical protein